MRELTMKRGTSEQALVAAWHRKKTNPIRCMVVDLSLVCLLQGFDVNFVHLHHRLPDLL
jgi:hypothetical protein